MPLSERPRPPLVTIKVGALSGCGGLHRVQIHIADGFVEDAQSELNRYGELLRGPVLFVKQAEPSDIHVSNEEDSGPHGHGGVQLVRSTNVSVERKECICGIKGCGI